MLPVVDADVVDVGVLVDVLLVVNVSEDALDVDSVDALVEDDVAELDDEVVRVRVVVDEDVCDDSVDDVADDVDVVVPVEVVLTVFVDVADSDVVEVDVVNTFVADVEEDVEVVLLVHESKEATRS